MKIAIHPNEKSFSKKWIIYCEENKIDYKIVNCYDTNIINQLEDCDILMWHHRQVVDHLFAKQLLLAVEQSGKKVFPDFKTGWHFDDKVGQKYLLEAIKAPLVPSYVFYNKIDALDWIRQTTFPKVFKLRGGSGSNNVLLVKSKKQARKYISKAFNKGFMQNNPVRDLKDRVRRYKEGKGNFFSIIKGIIRFIIPNKVNILLPKQKGYAYFQDFMPNNNSDIRVLIIGDKALAGRRFVRKGDFRASGSGNITFNPAEIDVRCVEIAFETSSKTRSQCTAYDFIFNEANNPLIVEMSYGSPDKFYDPSSGYWDRELKWHNEKPNPQAWMVEQIIK